MKRLLLALLILASSCTVSKINKSITKSSVFDKGHLGFMLVDPSKDKALVSINEDKYFIPASNTKLFTFYASYSVLGDGKINGLNYLEKGDSLIFWGTGDPSLLHPDFMDSTVVDFLRNSERKLFLVNTFDQVDAFGPGWSWDWYNAYYATERSAFPVYGNVVRFSKDSAQSGFDTYPAYFEPKLSPAPGLPSYLTFQRDRFENEYQYFTPESSQSFERDIPFITSAAFTAELLSEKTGKKVTLIAGEKYLSQDPKKLQTAPADSIYAQMMKISDNFLAEQLMLLVSDQLNNRLSTREAIDYAKENLLNDLPNEPMWYDGSGLSSRNMFTPRSIIALLEKIRAEVPLEKIKAYFPAGGESGTIRSWYPADEGQPPYIYAKTGTLSMSNALSGYLVTKSGKILHFSCLMNNYQIPSSELKTELQKVLYFIHDKY